MVMRTSIYLLSHYNEDDDCPENIILCHHSVIMPVLYGYVPSEGHDGYMLSTHFPWRGINKALFLAIIRDRTHS